MSELQKLFNADMKQLKKLIKSTKVFSPAGLASIAAEVAIREGFRLAADRIEQGGISEKSVAEANRLWELNKQAPVE